MQILHSTRKTLLPLIAICFIFFISCKKTNPNSVAPNFFLPTDEYIRYNVNGTDYSFNMPADSVLSNDSLETFNFIPFASVLGTRIPNITTDLVKINYQNNGMSVGSMQPLMLFQTPQTELYPYFAHSTPPLLVNITEYGAVGQYISGNFSGPLIGAPPGNLVYVITCSFRVKRRM